MVGGGGCDGAGCVGVDAVVCDGYVDTDVTGVVDGVVVYTIDIILDICTAGCNGAVYVVFFFWVLYVLIMLVLMSLWCIL